MDIQESIISAGFGGQGIMTLGKVLANAGMYKGLNVTWLPSYGAEVRGGTAHSMVKIESDLIGNPRVQEPNTAIIMNGPSLEKFEDRITPEGLLILNSSMALKQVERKDIEIIEAPLTEAAIALGNVRVANMIAVGIYEAKKKIFGRDILVKVMELMAIGREKIIPVNIKALDRGLELGKA